MRFCSQKTYFVQNTHYGNVGWSLHWAEVGRVKGVEYEAAVGAGKLMDGKCIRMLLKEAPDLGFLPTPTHAKTVKSEYRLTACDLNDRRQS